MEKHLLSKSTFIRGVQCLKSLYLHKKRPFLRDKLPRERLIIFKRGHEVGELAHQLFPGGINLQPGHPSQYRKAVMNTHEKIAEGYPVIYEAGFQSDQVMIFLDILVNTAMGWHAYEVKSSRGISDTYLMDAALQYYVMKGTGLDIKKISIIHVDEEYILGDAIEPAKLFKIVDVTGEALSRQEFVKEHIAREKETLALQHSPKIDVGSHCYEPYQCDFIGHCWKNVSPKEFSNAQEHFNMETTSRLILPEKKTTAAFLKLLPMRPALPRYKGTRPYQLIAYGYALRTGGQTSIKMFDPSENPEEALKKSLLAETAGNDPIISFGQQEVINSILDGKALTDLAASISDESNLNHLNEGDSLPVRLLETIGEQPGPAVYTSDAVCAHFYLKEYPASDTAAQLESYAALWLDAIEKLYAFLSVKGKQKR